MRHTGPVSNSHQLQLRMLLLQLVSRKPTLEEAKHYGFAQCSQRCDCTARVHSDSAVQKLRIHCEYRGHGTDRSYQSQRVARCHPCTITDLTHFAHPVLRHAFIVQNNRILLNCGDGPFSHVVRLPIPPRRPVKSAQRDERHSQAIRRAVSGERLHKRVVLQGSLRVENASIRRNSCPGTSDNLSIFTAVCKHLLHAGNRCFFRRQAAQNSCQEQIVADVLWFAIQLSSLSWC
mmetsp:Transcript_9655/g.21013  ORF Transcript_9655/g.21013 Transcript_9655/m.21013 type:complete len:233 (-) Transcript_9655:421-1119(-)